MRGRFCAHCGIPITVSTRNPDRRYCSPRCRTADWHARNRTTRSNVANGASDVANNSNG
jgi:endogenous inhibitor of DNA gyrase (YacG/DUF329 family)